MQVKRSCSFCSFHCSCTWILCSAGVLDLSAGLWSSHKVVFIWGWQISVSVERMRLGKFFFSFKRYLFILGSFPHSSFGKEPACNAGDLGLIPGEGNGNPLQYSCLENPIDRGAWQATVHGVARVRHDLVHDLTVTGMRDFVMLPCLLH